MGCYSCGHPVVTIQQGEADSASQREGAFISVCQDTGKMEDVQGMRISVLIYYVYTLPFFKCLLASHFPASDILLSRLL